ncbi:MAG: helix-turn-helix transcriptional regulator [Proteobacteria bacterium]|nr:helix-turn-helix transcriptional regulator [Pseudomonadota bacterium]
MVAEIRLTLYGLRVLSLFAKNETKWFSGSDVAKKTNLTNGTLYPLLFRLEGAGLLVSMWEDADPEILKRPRKRLYKITRTGINRLLFEQSK